MLLNDDEYFNNLNGDGEMTDDMYILIRIPIANWKSRGFSIHIPILSQCVDSPSKRGRVRAIPMRTNLFTIFFSQQTFLTLLLYFIYMYLISFIT